MGRTWSSMEDFEAFLDDGGMVEVDDDMPDEYRTAVFRFIELHATVSSWAASPNATGYR